MLAIVALQYQDMHLSEHILNQVSHLPQSDNEKGAETQSLSAEFFENCVNFLIVENYAPLFSEENLFLVEMFDETFIIRHIYSL